MLHEELWDSELLRQGWQAGFLIRACGCDGKLCLCTDFAGEEDVHAAPAIEDPTGGTAELEAELLDTPGPSGLPTHAAEGAFSHANPPGYVPVEGWSLIVIGLSTPEDWDPVLRQMAGCTYACLSEPENLQDPCSRLPPETLGSTAFSLPILPGL